MKEFVCIVCPIGCRLQIEQNDDTFKVTGNTCKRGEAFAIAEQTNPKRSLSTTVRTVFPQMPMLPVRTDGEIPKPLIFEAMKQLNKITVEKPVCCGDILLYNILDTGIDVIATSSIL